MDDPTRSAVERLADAVRADEADEAVVCLEQLREADAETRKRALRRLRELADECPETLAPLPSALTPFLTDEDRSVRLSTAKLFVALARERPAGLRAHVSALADRLADEAEFYYVRARSAEALGYLAAEYPDEVASPEVLADLRLGLRFDEPAVTEKLAKALAGVALGDPGRLRHHVADLAGHLDADPDLVRYHLCTALVAVGCDHPAALADAEGALVARLDDDLPQVRGRAAEALGLLARSGAPAPRPEKRLAEVCGDDHQFAAERARFALDALAGGADPPEGVGDPGAIRAHTDDVVAEITAPDAGECPHCGLALPGDDPPMCPRCGAPR
jgi:hypothetical protein